MYSSKLTRGTWAVMATIAVALCSCGEEETLPGVDGGVRADSGGGGINTDARGGSDAFVPPMVCRNNAECNDGVMCTVDECNMGTGRCLNRRDLERCECDPACMTRPSGGMGAGSWRMDGRNGVDFDEASGGLIVRAEARRADYLYIPNTGESTVSKWDAVTNTEIGRYRVGQASGECRGQCCHVNGCNMVSRIAVDGQGNGYAASRGFTMQGTVTKIAGERRDCVDRNMNGMIDTSAGAMDVRPLGQDECVLWNAPVGPVNAVLRSITLDRGDENFPEGYVWAGSCQNTGQTTGGMGLFQLNPRTGALIRTVPFGPCAYGAVVTADGTLWQHTLSQGISAVNSRTGAVSPLINNGGPTGSYGISADAQGRIWLTRGGVGALGYDPMTRQWTTVMVSGMNSSGITVDGMNRVWVGARSGVNNEVVSWDAAAFVGGGVVPAAALTRYTFTPRAGVSWTSTSALGADRAGAIWLTTSAPNPLIKFNPMTRVTETFDGPNRVYTYTDFTGAVRRLVIGTGTYTEPYVAECNNPVYAQLTWDAVTPMGTTLVFVLRTAANEAGLGAAMPVTLGTAPTDMSPVNVAARLMAAGVTPGKYASLTVTFNPTISPVQTPVLRSLGLSWRCPPTNPG